MLIVCPKCFTQYIIPDEIKLSDGQKFHCTACKNYFALDSGLKNGFATTDPEESEIIPTVSDVMNQQNEPEEIVSVTPQTGTQPPHAPQIQPVFEQPTAAPCERSPEPCFAEPLSLLSERPTSSDRLDSLPEAFKPVSGKKKSGALSRTLFWMALILGIGAFTYSQKDAVLQKLDDIILGSLDKNYQPDTPNTHNQDKSSVQAEVVQPNIPVARIVEPQNESETSSVSNEQVAVSDAPQATTDDTATSSEPVVYQPPVLQETYTGQGLPTGYSVNGEPDQPNQPEVIIPAQTTSGENANADSLVQQAGDFLTTNPTQQTEPTPNQPQVIQEQPVVSANYADFMQTGPLTIAQANRILKIQDIGYEISPNEVGVMRLMIKGIIANTELKKVTIPELKAIVYNDMDRVVARKRIVLSQPEIEGNSTQAFFSSVVPAPAQVTRVEVVFDE